MAAPIALSLSQFGRELEARISRFSACGDSTGFDDTAFDRLARTLFGLQYQANAAYRAWSDSRGVTPDSLRHWCQIPLVPTAAFKEVDLSCFDPSVSSRCFHSSGTTTQRPSRHWHHAESLVLYRESLAAWFRYHLAAEEEPSDESSRWESDGRIAILSLTPPAEAVPHSSLAYMIATTMERFGAGDSLSIGTLDGSGNWVLDTDRLLFALRRSLCSNRPVLLVGTAFNFVHFLDLAEERNLRYRLAIGSRLMETGGYKGRSRVLDAEVLHSELSRRLGIPRTHVITEYGMCELSSQAYSHRVGEAPSAENQFPPWTRIRVLSSETGVEVKDGEIGVLGVLDLANTWSVMGVQTGDLAIRNGNRFRLVGRAPQMEPRGCSLLTA